MHFSVIVPTYGRPAALQRCLTSLRQLRWPEHDFEIIVVDDGSPLPARTLEASFPDVLFLEQSNQGPAAARNTGAAAAKGRFLAFTDDDCEPDPDWLRRFAAALEEDPGALVGGTTRPAARSGYLDAVAQRIVDLVYDHYNDPPQNAQFLCSNNIAVSRQDYLAIGGFDSAVFRQVGAEDREFCDRWRFSGRPLRWVQSAVIYHWPQLTVASYCRMFGRYGAGAARYHKLRAQRKSGTLGQEASFHRHLPRLLWRRRHNSPKLPLLPTLALLVLWQLCNALGYFWEKLKQ